jgi:hypothetical protein
MKIFEITSPKKHPIEENISSAFATSMGGGNGFVNGGPGTITRTPPKKKKRTQ